MTRYKEDPEYIEAIRKNKCPYCQCSITIPYPTKKACSTCDWEHYGNPRLTAYKQVEQEITYNFNINNCVECQATLIYDRDTKELVCPQCGLLHTGPPIYGIDYPFGCNTNSNFLLLR